MPSHFDDFVSANGLDGIVDLILLLLLRHFLPQFCCMTPNSILIEDREHCKRWTRNR